MSDRGNTQLCRMLFLLFLLYILYFIVVLRFYVDLYLLVLEFFENVEIYVFPIKYYWYWFSMRSTR